MKCRGVLDDSSKVTESFSSFSFPYSSPLLVRSGLTPTPVANAFSSSVASFSTFPQEQWCVVELCQRLKCFMWRWTLFSFVICCSHTPEGYLNMVGRRSYNTLCGVNTVMVRSSPISFFMPSILQLHDVNGTLNKCFSCTKACTAH